MQRVLCLPSETARKILAQLIDIKSYCSVFCQLQNRRHFFTTFAICIQEKIRRQVCHFKHTRMLEQSYETIQVQTAINSLYADMRGYQLNRHME